MGLAAQVYKENDKVHYSHRHMYDVVQKMEIIAVSPYVLISASELPEWVGKAKMVDVREPGEFDNELGHIPGSVCIPFDQLKREALCWDRSQPILLICNSGVRSTRASGYLLKLGFETVVNLESGIVGFNAVHK